MVRKYWPVLFRGGPNPSCLFLGSHSQRTRCVSYLFLHLINVDCRATTCPHSHLPICRNHVRPINSALGHSEGNVGKPRLSGATRNISATLNALMVDLGGIEPPSSWELLCFIHATNLEIYFDLLPIRARGALLLYHAKSQMRPAEFFRALSRRGAQCLVPAT